MLVVSWVIFVGFSQGCGSATSMTALYVVYSVLCSQADPSQNRMSGFPRYGSIRSVQLDTNWPCGSWTFPSSQFDRSYDWGNVSSRLCVRPYNWRCSFSAFRLEMVVQHEVSGSILDNSILTILAFHLA